MQLLRLEVFDELHEFSEAAMAGVTDPVILSTNMPSYSTIIFLTIAIISHALVTNSLTVEEQCRGLDLPHL